MILLAVWDFLTVSLKTDLSFAQLKLFFFLPFVMSYFSRMLLPKFYVLFLLPFCRLTLRRGATESCWQVIPSSEVNSRLGVFFFFCKNFLIGSWDGLNLSLLDWCKITRGRANFQKSGRTDTKPVFWFYTKEAIRRWLGCRFQKAKENWAFDSSGAQELEI